MLTPMDIHNHQFKKSIRGYNENEVDDFLDRIVADLEKLLRENERLQNKLGMQENDLQKFRSLQKTMNDTLLVAQKTADDVISAAKKNADLMKEQTARECQNIREEARLEAQQTIADANAKHDAILEDYAKIVSKKNSFLLKIRTALESELAITNENLKTIPKIEIPIKKSEPVEKVQPVEKVAPVETPKPVEKPAEPVAPKKVPAPIEEEELTNLVDVSTKPTEKKTITDDTVIYKKSSAPEEAAS